jgi:hypothetical protein
LIGIADLPLHKGRVPPWMLKLMERMSLAILRALIELRGPEAVIEGLSDPYWFQAFNNVIGMDWDSSGSTTVLTGVLKSVTWKNPELGILVLGGKGENARKVPEEADKVAGILNVDPDYIKRFSKLAARVDSSFLQDGYELYHHSVFVSERGHVLVIQQGMNLGNKMARRYHINKFSVEDPHSAVAGITEEDVLNAVDKESREARRAYLDIVMEGPRRIIRLLSEANSMIKGSPTLEDFIHSKRKSKRLEKRPYYRPVPITPQLKRALEDLSNFSPSTEIELALAPGLGPKVVRALALIADLILNVPTSSKDPVTHPLNPFAYAYAVGGKDGVPYKYDPKTAKRVILTLEEAIEYAKLGHKEKLKAILRLKRLLDNIRWLND